MDNERWYTLPVLAGDLIRLEPLGLCHAAGYLAAGADEDVFRWLNTPGSAATGAPRTVDDARADIQAALDAAQRRVRFALAQLDARTGEFAGTSSYYDVLPELRTISIGHTWLGRRWWRTGANTESKLLMLTHAFETLGAARVVWHTDIYNERSQRAARRDARGRATQAPRQTRWILAHHGAVLDDRRRLARRTRAARGELEGSAPVAAHANRAACALTDSWRQRWRAGRRDGCRHGWSARR